MLSLPFLLEPISNSLNTHASHQCKSQIHSLLKKVSLNSSKYLSLQSQLAFQSRLGWSSELSFQKSCEKKLYIDREPATCWSPSTCCLNYWEVCLQFSHHFPFLQHPTNKGLKLQEVDSQSWVMNPWGSFQFDLWFRCHLIRCNENLHEC